MPDPAPAPGGAGGAPGGTPGGPGGTPAPNGQWYTGVEPDTLGYWQNKGWKTDDPKAFATDLTKSYKEFEKHFGVPPDQLAKLPGANSKPEDVKAFWQKLGVPGKAEDYDFTGYQIDGKPMSESLVASLRQGLVDANVAKDKASGIVNAFLKWMNDGSAQELTVLEGRIN